MLSSLSQSQRALVHDALVYAIRHGFREAFHNCDPGHPAYGMGADGDVCYADGPDRNGIYLVLQHLSRLDCEPSSIHDPVLSWADFCRLAGAVVPKPPA